ncbi:MAG: pyridoxal-phosphate dependent enzyme, partial [Opitutales bacterium]
RDWVTNVRDTHYILGSALGAHPYPGMVRDFHRIIGEETKKQFFKLEGKLPDEMIACVGGGSNAIGFFFDFLEEENVRLIGVEAGGRSLEEGQHAARFEGGKLGVLQGCKTWILQNEDGQINQTHSVSAGLDYAAIGPEHAFYRDRNRINYANANDADALEAFQTLSSKEGILPALETSHGLAYAFKRATELSTDKIICVNLSGRGDKDAVEVARLLGVDDSFAKIS